LEETKIPYESITLDPLKGDMTRPDVVAQNPNKLVPFINDNGFVVWESHSVMRYLTQRFPKLVADHWYPADTMKRSMVDRWLEWRATHLYPSMIGIVNTAAFAGTRYTFPDAATREETAKYYSPKCEDALNNLDAQLKKTKFVGGEEISIADISLWTHLNTFDAVGVDLSKKSNLARWYNEIGARPTVAAVNAQFAAWTPGLQAKIKEQKAKAPLNNEVLRREIEAAHDLFMAKWPVKDAEGLVALYTEDAVLLPPNAPVQTGREALLSFAKLFMEAGIHNVRLETGEFGYLDADQLWERGKYTFFSVDGKVMDVGKYLIIAKRVDGQWLICRDVFNSDGKQPDAGDNKDIMAVGEAFMAAWRAKDAAGVAACYTPEARLCPSGEEMIIGREGITACINDFMKKGVASVDIKMEEIHRGSVCSDTAFKRSSFLMKAANGDVLDEGKCLAIYKRVNGKWFVDQDMINSNRPPPAPAASA
jgi:glutathione S-transferase